MIYLKLKVFDFGFEELLLELEGLEFDLVLQKLGRIVVGCLQGFEFVVEAWSGILGVFWRMVFIVVQE